MSLDISAIPFSLYIHFPWCVQKCPYCDFNSHALRDQLLPEEAYIDQLCAEWDWRQKAMRQNRPLHSIFIGGGTPSLIKPQGIARLLAHIKSSTACHPDLEITMEANPGTIDQAHISALPATGVNRLSIGVQSFNHKALKMLGRIHDAQQAQQAFIAARKAGFKRINLDLMHGLPGQNTTQALADLQQAVNLGADHISWYQLTIEANTYFARFPPRLPDEDQLADIQHAGEQYLLQHGYSNYEVSAYSSCTQQECLHNLNYWQFGDYLGIGAGAHSKISFTNAKIIRQANAKHPRSYLAAQWHDGMHEASGKQDRIGDCPTLSSTTWLDRNDLMLEFMLCALRLTKPLAKSVLKQRTGLAEQDPSLMHCMAQAIENGLITESKSAWHVTAHGRRYLNDLITIFS